MPLEFPSLASPSLCPGLSVSGGNSLDPGENSCGPGGNSLNPGWNTCDPGRDSLNPGENSCDPGGNS